MPSTNPYFIRSFQTFRHDSDDTMPGTQTDSLHLQVKQVEDENSNLKHENAVLKAENTMVQADNITLKNEIKKLKHQLRIC